MIKMKNKNQHKYKNNRMKMFNNCKNKQSQNLAFLLKTRNSHMSMLIVSKEN